jgi:MFS family permease
VMLFAAASGALMPVLARQRVGVSAGQFGMLTTATGIGAVLTALALPRIRQRFGPDLIATGGTIVLAIGLFALGQTTSLVVFTTVLVIAGAAQLCVFSTTFSTAQAVLPNWVRGRGLAIAMLVVQGTTVVASLGWGALMSAQGAPFTFGAAGIGLAIVAVLLLPLRLAGRTEVDVSPAPAQWPHPHTALDIAAGRGPVLVTVRYRVRSDAVDEFIHAMQAVRHQRRRNGALNWGLYEPAHHYDVFVETFSLATWAEHEREQERRTAADAALHDAAHAFLVEPPSVDHLIGTSQGLHRRGAS